MRHNLLFCDERVNYNITELITNNLKRDDFLFLTKKILEVKDEISKNIFWLGWILMVEKRKK